MNAPASWRVNGIDMPRSSVREKREKRHDTLPSVYGEQITTKKFEIDDDQLIEHLKNDRIVKVLRDVATTFNVNVELVHGGIVVWEFSPR